MPHLRWLFSLLLLALLLPACDSNLDEDLPETDPALVTAWMQFASRAVHAENVNPAQASRLYAYAGIALYEGLVPGYPRYRSLAGQLHDLPGLPAPERGTRYDWPAVANAAERVVLGEALKLFSTSIRDSMNAFAEQQHVARAATGIPASILESSRTYGERLGDALVAWMREDGYDASRPLAYTAPVGAGLWEPTPPIFAPPMEPFWGTLRPFALASTDACAPPPPTPYSTDPASPFYQDMVQVYEASQALTAEHEAVARFWSDDPGATGTPPGHWIVIARQRIPQQTRSLIEAAEVYALTGVTVADAFIVTWKEKYRSNYIRPITAINQLIDRRWRPFLVTPPFPEYPSGHSVCSGAAATVLTALLGETTFADSTHVGRDLPVRTYPSFEAAAQEAAISRLYGGIHYREAIENGLEQGRCIGNAVVAQVKTRR